MNGTVSVPGLASKLGLVKVSNSKGTVQCVGVLLDNMTVLTMADCAPGTDAVASIDGKQLPVFPSAWSDMRLGNDLSGAPMLLTTLRLKYAAPVNGSTTGFLRDTYAGSAAALLGTTLRCYGYGNKAGLGPTNELVQADLPVAEVGKGYLRVGRGPGEESLTRGDIGGSCFLGDKLVGIISADVDTCPLTTCKQNVVTLAPLLDARRALEEYRSAQVIKTRSSGQCMSLDATGKPHATACDAFDDSQWVYGSRFFYAVDQAYDSHESFTSHRTGKLLSVAIQEDGDYAFDALVQAEVSAGVSFSWFVKESSQPGYHEIHSTMDTGQCWQQTGAAYQLAPCNNTASQQFQFLVYPELNDLRLHEGGGLCIDVPGAKQTEGAPVAHETCSGASNQLWQVTRDFSSNYWDTSLHLHPRHAPSKCLTVAGGSKATGAKLEQRTCDGSAAQEFLMIRRGDGVRIKNRNSNLCVWRPWHLLGSHWSGDTLLQGDCNDAGSAAWTFL